MPLLTGAIPSPRSKLAAAQPFRPMSALIQTMPSVFGCVPPNTSAFGNTSYGDCLDASSEVLTSNGWVQWPDYDGQTPLATMNPASRMLEFQAPSSVVRRDHDGPMVFSDHRGLDFAVTPNHRMFHAPYVIPNNHNRASYVPGSCGYADFRFGLAAELPSRCLIPGTTSGFIGTELKKLGIGNRTLGWLLISSDFLGLLPPMVMDRYRNQP